MAGRVLVRPSQTAMAVLVGVLEQTGVTAGVTELQLQPVVVVVVPGLPEAQRQMGLMVGLVELAGSPQLPVHL
jgi:hypothetical protein